MISEVAIQRNSIAIRCFVGAWTAMGQQLLDVPRARVQPAEHSKLRISVVVPAHNASTTIEQTLQSILAAIEPADDVIVVENGSTDGTLNLLRNNYGVHPQVRILSSDQKGAALARNLGVEAASDADFIAFCDADDTWMSEKILIVKAAIKTFDADIIFHPMLAIGKGQIFAEASSFVSKRLPKSGNMSWDLAMYGNFIPTSGFVIRTSCLPSPVFLNSLTHTQDYEAWCAIAENNPSARIAYIDRLLTSHQWMAGLSKSVSLRMANIAGIAQAYMLGASRLQRVFAVGRTLLHIVYWHIRARQSPIDDFFARALGVSREIRRVRNLGD